MNQEYTVTKKSEGTYKLSRFLMLLLYVSFVLGTFVIIYSIRIIPVFALVPVLLWILILATWRYVSIEYKYKVESGMLILYTIYGGKKKKEMARLHIKEATLFTPLEKAKEKIKDFSPQRTISLLSSSRTPSDPYALMIDTSGTHTLVLLEVPEPSLKAIRYYLSDATRSTI